MDLSGAPQPQQQNVDSEQIPPLGQPPSTLFNRAFYNRSGEIRSGWRILIYLSLALLLFGLEFIIVAFLPQAQNPYSISAIIVGEFTMFGAAFGAALIVARLENRPRGLYGLPLNAAFGKRFWQGALVGLCEISFIVGVMKLYGAYSFGNLSFQGAKILQWALLWLVAATLIGLSEEFLFRGYLQRTLAEGIGFWPAALILSALFACAHLRNNGENWIGVANIFFTGLLWVFTLRRTGTLWFAVGWHAAFDFGESFLYSVPDSGGIFEGHLSNATVGQGHAWLTGGKVGPEASVLAFVTLAIGAIVVHFWFPAEQEPGKVE